MNSIKFARNSCLWSPEILDLLACMEGDIRDIIKTLHKDQDITEAQGLKMLRTMADAGCWIRGG